MPESAPTARMNWLTRHIPTRENIQRNRLLRPFAPHLTHPALWRMSRKSVPRGVALGLFVGIIIPFMHTAIAAVLAIPLRANVAIAAAVTLVINPLTIPPLYWAASADGARGHPAGRKLTAQEQGQGAQGAAHASVRD